VRGLKPGPLTADSLAAAVAAAGGSEWTDRDHLAVAVSGGPDSLALLWLAAHAFPGRAHILTFDHRLRAASADEAETVARLADSVGLPHATLTPETSIPATNLQAEARAARFATLENWCTSHGVRWLLTAHHADDQAETLLMRLARGSGLDGLVGIRARRALSPTVTLLRPLLGWRKSDLAAIVAAAGWTAADDPSNQDLRFDRTAARNLLRTADWLDPQRLAASADHLAEAQRALAWMADEIWRTRGEVTEEGVMLDPEALPAELRRRLLVRGLAEMRETAPRGSAIFGLMKKLEAGNSGTIGAVWARSRDGRWLLSPAPLRR